jgi:hypothetical protein
VHDTNKCLLCTNVNIHRSDCTMNCGSEEVFGQEKGMDWYGDVTFLNVVEFV